MTRRTGYLRRALVAACVIAPLALVSANGLAEGTAAPASSAKPPKAKAKMAYVDFDRAVRENEEGLRASAALARVKAEKQRGISAIEERLARQQEELKAMAQGASPNKDMQNAALQYQKDLQAYQELLKRTNAELAERDDALFIPIERKVKAVLARFSESEGWDLVVDKKAYWGSTSNGLDLTDRVICDFNWGAGACGTGITPLAKAPAPAVSPAAPASAAK
jgi:Skp family chaperone for outer membrane proteins